MPDMARLGSDEWWRSGAAFGVAVAVPQAGADTRLRAERRSLRWPVAFDLGHVEVFVFRRDETVAEAEQRHEWDVDSATVAAVGGACWA